MAKYYDVFLSYSHADLPIAELLSKRIRRFKIPSKRVGLDQKKLEVFRDKERLSASSDLTNELTEHLSASKHLVLLISPAAKNSVYVNKEVAAYLNTRDVKSIIFVLVEGGLIENLPPVLKDKIAEPLFIDLSNLNKKKFRYESLRLIAALINVDFTLLSLEDLKYRRRKRQITIAGLLTALVVVASFYLIISTSVYHWKPVKQPKPAYDIMPVHEIVINRKDPSIILFKGVNARYGTNPRPEGGTIGPVDTTGNYYYHDIIPDNEKLRAWLKQQKEMRPVISIDFRIPGNGAKGEINIYAVLSDNDSIYFLRNFHFKGKTPAGMKKEVNTCTMLGLRHPNMSDLYPLMKELADEKVFDLYDSRIEASVRYHLEGKTEKEFFGWRSNDEGYDEATETWGPRDIILSNHPAEKIMIDGEPLAGLENDYDVWQNILKNPDWMRFEKRDKKSIRSFTADYDVDSIPAVMHQWFRKNDLFNGDLPSMDPLITAAKTGEYTDVSAIVAGFGKQKGVILEIRTSHDSEGWSEDPHYYFSKIANRPLMELKLPEVLKNSLIIDLLMLDAAGKNFMILTNNKGYFRTFDAGKTWTQSNYGEISFQGGAGVKTLVTPSSKIYAFADRNVSATEGPNTLFVLEERNWFQRLRIGFAQLINY
jgi:hypothetical protein